MAKLSTIENHGDSADIHFFCPGCQIHHGVWTKHQDPKRNWQFNGDMEKPTFSPSILVRYPYAGENRICHSFVRDGNIQFLSDCSHHLKNQTVELPEIE